MSLQLAPRGQVTLTPTATRAVQTVSLAARRRADDDDDARSAVFGAIWLADGVGSWACLAGNDLELGSKGCGMRARRESWDDVGWHSRPVGGPHVGPIETMDMLISS